MTESKNIYYRKNPKVIQKRNQTGTNVLHVPSNVLLYWSWQYVMILGGLNMAMWSGKFPASDSTLLNGSFYKSWLLRRASVDLWTVPNCGLNSNLTHFEQFWNAVWCSIDTYFMILLCGLLVCHKYILMISATSTCNNHNLSLNLCLSTCMLEIGWSRSTYELILTLCIDTNMHQLSLNVIWHYTLQR